MAGSAMTFAYHEIGGIHKVVIDWTSDDTTGAVSGATKRISAELLKAVTNPSATAPTADYDIALTDAESEDIVGNCYDDLADRHTSNTEVVDFFLTGAANVGARPVVAGPVTVAVTAAGNSKLGRIVLYYRPNYWRGDG